MSVLPLSRFLLGRSNRNQLQPVLSSYLQLRLDPSVHIDKHDLLAPCQIRKDSHGFLRPPPLILNLTVFRALVGRICDANSWVIVEGNGGISHAQCVDPDWADIGVG